MRFSNTSAVFVFAIGLGCASPALSANEVKVGPWRILSGESSAGGSYCTMQLGDEVKGLGLQVVSSGEMYLSVANPDWKLTAKQSYPSKFAIDNNPTWAGDAIAVTPNILVIGLPPTSDPVGTVAGGKSFIASTDGGSPLTFDLGGAGAARDALKTCMNGFPAPKASVAAAAAAPTKTTVGDWEVEAVADAPGQCTIARDYFDKEDGNAENAVVVRGMPDGIMVALTYAKWNWTAGEKTKAALVTPDGILDADAEWTADKTGKVLFTQLPADKQAALSATSQLIVKFPDGDASFDVPKIGDALSAMAACAKAK